MGITDHAALGAAKGDTNNCAFPGHPHGQSAHLVERDFGAETNAALGRATVDVMLNTITGKHFNVAIIHTHREMNDKLTFRFAQDCAHCLREAKTLGGLVELGDRHIIGIHQVDSHTIHSSSLLTVETTDAALHKKRHCFTAHPCQSILWYILKPARSRSQAGLQYVPFLV